MGMVGTEMSGKEAVQWKVLTLRNQQNNRSPG